MKAAHIDGPNSAVDRMLENTTLSLKLEVGGKYAVEKPLPESSDKLRFSYGARGYLQPGVPFRIKRIESVDQSAHFPLLKLDYILQIEGASFEVRVTASNPNEFAQYLTTDFRVGKLPGRPLRGTVDLKPAFRASDTLKDKVAVVLAYDTAKAAKADAEKAGNLARIPAKAELIAQRTPAEKPDFNFEDLKIGMNLYVRRNYFSKEQYFDGHFNRSRFSLSQGETVQVVDAEKKTVLSKNGGAAQTTLTLRATVMQEDVLDRRKEVPKTYTFTVPLEEALQFFSPDTRKQDSTPATLMPKRAADVLTARRSLRENDTPEQTIQIIRDSVTVVSGAEVPPAPPVTTHEGPRRGNSRDGRFGR